MRRRVMEELSPFLYVMYVIAIVSSVLFVIRAIMMLFGLGGFDADVGGDGDAGGCDGDDGATASGLHFFTLNGILSFLCIGSWATLAGHEMSGSYVVASIMGLFSGAAMMVVVALIMRAVMNLQESGNLKMPKAIGKIGEVYLTVPAVDKGEGKVNLELNGALREFQAVSHDETPIETGTRVRVVGLEGEDVLVVQRESEEMA